MKNDQIIRRAYELVTKAIDEQERWVDVIVSTDSIDLAGEVVEQDWDLSRYVKNPVVLYFHNYVAMSAAETLPIGFSTNVSISGGKLYARLNFVDAKANPLAEQVFQGYVQKSIRAVSAGFAPGAVSYDETRDVFVLSANTLLEISACPIGMNGDAVTQSKALRHEQLRALASATKSLPITGAIADQSPAQSGITGDTHDMKLFAKALGLNESASEAEVLSALTMEREQVSTERGRTKSLLDAIGSTSVDHALGVVKGLKDAAAEVPALKKSVGELTARTEASERATVIKAAVDAKKFTPAQKAWAESRVKNADGTDGAYAVPLETLKGFIDSASVIPALADPPVTEPGDGGAAAPTFEGKSWEQMKPAERAELHQSNKGLYDAMKAAHVKKVSTKSTRA